MTLPSARIDELLADENWRFAITGAAQAFCNRGITIACPWEGDLDDEERERFDALVAAIDSFNALRSPPIKAQAEREGEDAGPVAWLITHRQFPDEVERHAPGVDPLTPADREAGFSATPLFASPLPVEAGTVDEQPVEIAHDGFVGDIIGRYQTREGKRGVVLQQVGTRVVHVYGEKWLPSALHVPGKVGERG